MERIAVSVRRSKREHEYGFSILMVFLALFLYLITSFYLKGAYNEARERYMEALKAQKILTEMNDELRTKKSVITQRRFLELQAGERLGLRHAKEEEVLVSR
ncbi:MAG: hypothetical protein N2745_00665 [Syntrophorhabdaceae bacterium]|nr:hypothetical protein [Syntrophorhabdaceae bacterium]